MNNIVLGMVSGAISALLVDLKAFKDARERDKSATFDWVLCGTRVAIGVLTGTGLGAAAGAL